MNTAAILGLSGIFTLAATVKPCVEPPEGADAVGLVCLEQDHTFTLADLRGRFVAVHVLPPIATDGLTDAVRDYVARADSRAGVIHVFVVGGSADAAESWWEPFRAADRCMIAHDPTGALAESLGVRTDGSGPVHTLVLLDGSGRALARRRAEPRRPAVPFETFAAALDAAARTPALEQYNLPRDGGPAVGGYDVVAYHTESSAVRGRPEYASLYRGVEYRFASPEHRARFASDPERYLPTYGGWCASAMGAKGTKVEIDPTNFKVKDGRLHLFYKSVLADALKDWNKHEAEWEPAADRNWKKLTGEDPVTRAR